MSQRTSVTAYAVTALLLLSSGGASAQSADAFQTSWGAPDLGGVWDFRSITPLERPEELSDQEFLTEEEAAQLEQETLDRNARLLIRPAERTTVADQVDQREDGTPGFYNNFWLDRGTTIVETRRTSLIVDPPSGRLPPRTAAAMRRAEVRQAYRRDHPADSWEDRGLNDRCMFTTGLPILPSAYNNNVHIFQTRDHVALLVEMTHTVRIVPLAPFPSMDIPQFVGTSRGYWEGETLVVETAGFHSLTSLRGSTPNARLTERFTRTGADTLTYEFTVDDPDTWTQPWTAEVVLTRSDEPLYEYACHEGNYAMEGILAGARAAEAAAGSSEPLR